MKEPKRFLTGRIYQMVIPFTVIKNAERVNRLEAESERKERKKEDGSNFLGKHIVLVGLPGSVPA